MTIQEAWENVKQRIKKIDALIENKICESLQRLLEEKSMTINEAWENVKHRLNEYVELSHSYSPRDNEAERIVEAFIAESPLKAFVITLFNSAGSANRNRTQDYKNGYIDALCDIMDMFIEQE